MTNNIEAHPADPTGYLINYSLYGKSSLHLQGSSVTANRGWVGSDTDCYFQSPNNPAAINGKLKCGAKFRYDGWGIPNGSGSLVLNDTVFVNGNITGGVAQFNKPLYYNGAITGINAFAQGSTNGFVIVNTPIFPTGVIVRYNTNNLNYSSNATLNPGSYGSLTLNAATVTLNASDSGVYHFKSINLNYGSQLLINKLPNQTVRILVDSGITFIAGTSIRTNSPGDYGKVLVFQRAHAAVTINSNVRLDASLLAPRSLVSINYSVTINGQVLADSINTLFNFNGNNGIFAPFNPDSASILFATGQTLREDTTPIQSSLLVSRQLVIQPRLTQGPVTLIYTLGDSTTRATQKSIVLASGSAHNICPAANPAAFAMGEIIDSILLQPGDSANRSINFCVYNDSIYEGNGLLKLNLQSGDTTKLALVNKTIPISFVDDDPVLLHSGSDTAVFDNSLGFSQNLDLIFSGILWSGTRTFTTTSINGILNSAISGNILTLTPKGIGIDGIDSIIVRASYTDTINGFQNSGIAFDTIIDTVKISNHIPLVKNPIGNDSLNLNFTRFSLGNFDFRSSSGVFNDPDTASTGDTLTYVVKSISGIVNPFFDASNKILTIDSINGQSGCDKIVVTAIDKHAASVSDTFAVCVNQAPVFTINPVTINEPQSGDSVIELAINAIVSAISYGPASTALSSAFASADNALLIPVSGAVKNGSSTIVISGTDSLKFVVSQYKNGRDTISTIMKVLGYPTHGGIDSALVKIPINITSIPSTPLVNGSIANDTLLENFVSPDSIVLSGISFSDPDSSILTLTANSPAGIVSILNPSLDSKNTNSANGVTFPALQLASIANKYGITPLTLTATNTAGKKVSTTFDLVVLHVNQAPNISGRSDTVDETQQNPDSSYKLRYKQYVNLTNYGQGDSADILKSVIFESLISGTGLLVGDSLSWNAADTSLNFRALQNQSGTIIARLLLRDNGGTNLGGRDSTIFYDTIVIKHIVSKSSLTLVKVKALTDSLQTWTASKDNNNIQWLTSAQGVKGMDTLWTNQASFDANYLQNGVGVDSLFALNASIIDANFGIQTVQRIYQNPLQDQGDSSSFTIAYSTIAPMIKLDTNALKMKKDSNGVYYINDSLWKSNQGHIPFHINFIGVNPSQLLSLDTMVQPHLINDSINVLIVTYTDRYGNTSSDHIQIMLDTIAPVVHILSPRGSDGADTSVIFSLVSPVHWTINGINQTSDTIQSLGLGLDTIIRKACDFAGNCGSDTVYITPTLEDNRIRVTVPVDVIHGLSSQSVQAYYNANGITTPINPNATAYTLSAINPTTGSSTLLAYYNGRTHQIIDSNHRIATDSSIKIGIPIDFSLQFPLNNDSVGICQDGSSMWNLKVLSISVEIYDQIGQFVTLVQVPTFSIDQSAYQSADGLVNLVMQIPTTENDMRSIDGIRWGTGVYLMVIRSATEAQPINCNQNANPGIAQMSTMKKIGYSRGN